MAGGDPSSGPAEPYILPAIEVGRGEGAPVVLLHGFAGAALSWEALQPRLAKSRRTIAYDLPGHAAAKSFPGFGPAKVAARAVLADLDRRGIARAHLVGHSMGGAVAALCGLFDPLRCASLVLLAPGGFGPAIGADALRRIVEGDGDAAAAALAALAAPGWIPDAETLARYRRVHALQSPTALAALYALLFRGGMQGVLPLDAIAATGVPVTLIWGRLDEVTPFAQSAEAPSGFALTALDDVGHMLIDEAPEATLFAIEHALALADARSASHH